MAWLTPRAESAAAMCAIPSVLLSLNPFSNTKIGMLSAPSDPARLISVCAKVGSTCSRFQRFTAVRHDPAHRSQLYRFCLAVGSLQVRRGVSAGKMKRTWRGQTDNERASHKMFYVRLSGAPKSVCIKEGIVTCGGLCATKGGDHKGLPACKVCLI
jgi:hypothetical protein